MAYPAYVREKARRLRVERQLSVVEIAERLALPKTTIWYWVRDLPLRRPRNENPLPATRAMQRKFRLLREEAYEEGRESFDVLVADDPTFRDFVCMYIGEGYKRSRNVVAIGNSDPRVVALATRWLRCLSKRQVRFELQYHADQDLADLREFWGELLEVDGSGLQSSGRATAAGSADGAGAPSTAC